MSYTCIMAAQPVKYQAKYLYPGFMEITVYKNLNKLLGQCVGDNCVQNLDV